MSTPVHPPLHIIATSDIHGAFFPYDFMTLSRCRGSLARVSAYIKRIRQEAGADNVIVLDCGDLLQGQPPAYYYNFIAPQPVHPAARMMKHIGYDAMTIGNHDIEEGHEVYDSFCSDVFPIPVLGANVVGDNGKPYFKPYVMIERGGFRVAVIGLVTPAVPAWVPRRQWEGLTFEPMLENARLWVDHVRTNEKPDLVVGLFHSGYESDHLTGKWLENQSGDIAREVPGFDIVIMGHDHVRTNRRNPIPVVNPGAYANSVVHLRVAHEKDADGRFVIKSSLHSVSLSRIDTEFMEEFESERLESLEFVTREIGVSRGVFTTRDAFFGPSAFLQLIHEVQLEATGVQISLASPLSFDSSIQEGMLTVSDLFKFYRYDNQLCVISLSGHEIKNYLEMSYDLWTRRMLSPDDSLMLFGSDSPDRPEYAKLKNPVYNFDSAFGIDYTVDVSKPRGEKVMIERQTSTNEPFDLDAVYTVAVNAYRANGGGDLLTLGAGIDFDKLSARVVSTSPHDMRYHLLELIKRRGEISPHVTHNWRFVPESLVETAIVRDRDRLFSKD